MMIKTFAKISFAFILFVTISSCERKSCSNVACPVGQACNSGKCYCADGYEGSDCQTLSYQKYTALNGFTHEQCNASPPFGATTSVYITWDGSYINQIHIHNLMGGSCDVLATISTDTYNEGNIVTISQQDCGGSSISGQGNYDKLNHRLTLQLYYTVSGTPYTCTTTLY